MQYLFGDTDIASQRLKVLAEVFAQPTRAFLLEANIGKIHLAIDLGCGPGYSTHFLAAVIQGDQFVGLDNSEHFISLAQKTKTKKVWFYLHDVTSVPFPVGPSDLLFCRYLLTHLREPQTVVMKWATQLRPKGLLFMEEVEWIHTSNSVFTTYLKIVETMLESQSNKLYIGPVLETFEDTNILKRRSSQVRRFWVSNDKAATLFFLNIQSWKHQPFVRANYSSKMIAQLETELKALSKESSDQTETEWGLRQIVYERE